MTDGFQHITGYLSLERQLQLVGIAQDLAKRAPFFTPTMPGNGKPFSVRMTNAGPIGWVSDKSRGYRYQAEHPITGRPWPPIPDEICEIWRGLLPGMPAPECCLVNYYGKGARMGLHRDADEVCQTVPVLSISLGDRATFRVGA